MPFSSLADPVEVARASAALDAAWKEVSPTLDPCDERERIRLAYIVASLLTTTDDEDDLVRLAIEKYRSQTG
ncbi:MAG: hypothetical protein DI537_31180 [Stutzerimonas stutzeri]|nr:MAG: hypothetical protein DI537_31180 [Stutzerimonas stutzeri]